MAMKLSVLKVQHSEEGSKQQQIVWNNYPQLFQMFESLLNDNIYLAIIFFVELADIFLGAHNIIVP
jgi:hypothetical protein